MPGARAEDETGKVGNRRRRRRHKRRLGVVKWPARIRQPAGDKERRDHGHERERGTDDQTTPASALTLRPGRGLGGHEGRTRWCSGSMPSTTPGTRAKSAMTNAEQRPGSRTFGRMPDGRPHALRRQASKREDGHQGDRLA
jgi:hypothetical protein